jgi:putative FmdB family regulatory protein
MEMPTYEYRCCSCGRRFEVFHGVNESVEECQSCGGREVRRVFHPVGVIFKGPGFYVTDSRGGNGGGGASGLTAEGEGGGADCKEEKTASGSTSSAGKEED